MTHAGYPASRPLPAPIQPNPRHPSRASAPSRDCEAYTHANAAIQANPPTPAGYAQHRSIDSAQRIPYRADPNLPLIRPLDHEGEKSVHTSMYLARGGFQARTDRKGRVPHGEAVRPVHAKRLNNLLRSSFEFVPRSTGTLDTEARLPLPDPIAHSPCRGPPHSKPHPHNGNRKKKQPNTIEVMAHVPAQPPPSLPLGNSFERV